MRMMSAERSLLGLVGSSWGRLLALFLLGFVLLCHGIYGVAHLCSTSPVAMHGGHEHSASTGTGVDTHDKHPPCHLGGAEYFAVLFAAFLGLVLGLLLKGARLWAGVAPSLVFCRALHRFVLHPPRGPTLPVLQVFRL